MVLINVYGPGTWRWAFLCRFTSPSSCFYHIPFPGSTAQVIGEFWTNRWSAMSDVAPTVLALYRNIIGARLHPALKGQQAKRDKFAAPIKSFRGIFFICCASPTGAVRIAGLIVLAQHKGNKNRRSADIYSLCFAYCYRTRLLIWL
jgi:hypothetical protein